MTDCISCGYMGHILPWKNYRLTDAEKIPLCTVHVLTLVSVSTITR